MQALTKSGAVNRGNFFLCRSPLASCAATDCNSSELDETPVAQQVHREKAAFENAAIEVVVARLDVGSKVVLASAALALAGLCLGAGNAIALAFKHPRIVGKVLPDSIRFPDYGLLGLKTRKRLVKFMQHTKHMNPARLISRLKHAFETLIAPRVKTLKDDNNVDPLPIRDYPTYEQIRAAFEAIRQRAGQVLSLFMYMYYALQCYNRSEQLERTLKVNGYQAFSTELFWPQTHHTYALEAHRYRVIEKIKTWAAGYVHPKLSGADAQRQALGIHY